MMKVAAVVMGLIGLAVLPSSPGLGLLMLGLAVGLWMADSGRDEQEPVATVVVESWPPAPRPVPRPAEIQWLGPGRDVMVHGYLITDALIYYSSRHSAGYEASCIDLSLRVGTPVAEPKGELGHWPRYERMSPDQRANYLQWLDGGRQDWLNDIGYAFLYFYGLERRALVDGKDHELILEEVVRLLGQYRRSGSFEGYLSGLIEYLTARRGLTLVDGSWFRRFLARSPSPMALAWLAVHDLPLPAELAFEVARQDLRSPRSVVVKRVPEQFRDLFQRKYGERFGDGMKLRTAARPYKLTYRSAGPTFYTTTPTARQASETIETPNVYGIRSQFKPLVQIWTECIEELRPLSRQAAKGIDLTSRDAYRALPAELRAEADHPDRQRWEQVVADQAPRGAFALVSVSSLALLQGIEERPKLTRRQSEELAATACEVGFGIAPDFRAIDRAYRWDEQVALFRMEQPAPPKDPAFACAACMAELGMALAAADGTLDDEEVLHITEFLEDQFALSSDDTLHLEGYRQVLLKQPPRRSALGKRLRERLTADQRELIARFLVGVAAASGSIHGKEITALKRAYRSLGVEVAKLADLLSEVRGAEEPVEVQATSPAATGEPIPVRGAPPQDSVVVLDMSRVHRLFEGTAEVQRILVGAMVDTDEVEESQSAPPSDRPVLTTDVTVASAVPVELLDGLDSRYHPVLSELLSRNEWHPDEVDAVARRHGLMPSGMVGVVNDWAVERFNECLIDDQQDPYAMRHDLLEQAQ